MRKGIIFTPTYITQEEFRSKKARVDTMWTSKVEVMEGGIKFSNLIESSVYNTNPFHYISMVSKELKWVINNRDRFNVHTCNV